MVIINTFSRYLRFAILLWSILLGGCQNLSTQSSKIDQTSTVPYIIFTPTTEKVPTPTVTSNEPEVVSQKTFEHVEDAIWSPSGEKILISWSTLAAPWHFRASLYEAKTMNEIWTTNTDDFFGSYPAYSLDGKHILTAGGYTVSTWDAATGKLISDDGGGNAFVLFVFSPNQNNLFIGQSHNLGKDDFSTVLNTWNIAQDELTKIVEKKGLLNRLEIRSDGKVLALSLDHDKVVLWDVSSNTEKCTISGEAPRFMHKSNNVFILDAETIKVFNSETCELIKSLTTEPDVTDFVINSDDALIAMLEEDNTLIKVYSLRDQKTLFVLKNDYFFPEKFSFNPEGGFIMTVRLERKPLRNIVEIWKIPQY
jgi:hypothetical protein